MAVLLLDLVIARSQLHCKRCVLLDNSSKDAGLECCSLYIGCHKIYCHPFGCHETVQMAERSDAKTAQIEFVSSRGMQKHLQNCACTTGRGQD